MPEPIVFVVDDDDAVRDSLSLLLETSGHRVRAFASAQNLLDALTPEARGCIIADVRMPGMDGLELQERLAARRIGLPVIIMTGHGDVPIAVRAMKAGAVDFIEKPFHDETLLAAIGFALARHADDSRRKTQSDEVRSRLESLSGREREVLDGLVAGKPNKIIAHDLGISARTVEVYRANVMTKMRADSLSDLVRMVLLLS
jgi:two-component system, LuxR family, response regulator FixJ